MGDSLSESKTGVGVDSEPNSRELQVLYGLGLLMSAFSVNLDSESESSSSQGFKTHWQISSEDPFNSFVQVSLQLHPPLEVNKTE